MIKKINTYNEAKKYLSFQYTIGTKSKTSRLIYINGVEKKLPFMIEIKKVKEFTNVEKFMICSQHIQCSKNCPFNRMVKYRTNLCATVDSNLLEEEVAIVY